MLKVFTNSKQTLIKNYINQNNMHQFITIILYIECLALFLLMLHFNFNLDKLKEMFYKRSLNPKLFTCIVYVLGFISMRIYYYVFQENWHNEIKRWTYNLEICPH